MNNKQLKNFWSKVKLPDNATDEDCWEWIGAKNTYGGSYGRFGMSSYGSMKLAHRVSYEHYIGPIPDNLVLLHKCDRPSCINPNHLLVGTQSDNRNDMVSKRRQEEFYYKIADKIKQLKEQGISPQYKIAEMVGVSPQTVSYTLKKYK